MNAESNNPSSVYFEMHRLSWTDEDGEQYTLFLAGTERVIVCSAASRLAATIAAESGLAVADDTLASSNVDLDDLPF